MQDNMMISNSPDSISLERRLIIREGIASKIKLSICLAALVFVGLTVPKYSVIVLFLLVFLLARPKALFLKENLTLFLFLVTYYAMTVFHGEQETLRAFYNILIIQSAYVLGVYTDWRELPYWPYNSLLALIAFSLGFFFNSFYTFQYIYSNYPFLIGTRTYINIWTNELGSPLALATFTIPVIMFALPSIYLLSKFRFRMIINYRHLFIISLLILLILSGVLSLIMNAVLANRTPFIVFILSSITAIIYLFFRQNLSENIKMTLAGLIITVIIISISSHYYDIDMIYGLVKLRFEAGIETSRYDLWIQGFYNIFENPFGGGQVDVSMGEYWFHNLWLDIVRASGIVPLLFMLIFQGQHVRSISLIIKRNKDNFINLSIISLLIGVLSLYLAEPILEASVIFFAFTMFFVGSLKNMDHAISEASIF